MKKSAAISLFIFLIAIAICNPTQSFAKNDKALMNLSGTSSAEPTLSSSPSGVPQTASASGTPSASPKPTESQQEKSKKVARLVLKINHFLIQAQLKIANIDERLQNKLDTPNTSTPSASVPVPITKARQDAVDAIAAAQKLNDTFSSANNKKSAAKTLSSALMHVTKTRIIYKQLVEAL